MRFLILAACLLAAILTANAFTVPSTNTYTPPAHVITLRADADPAAVAADFGLTPVNVYRHALKGFAVTVPSDQLNALKHDSRVLAVERNGRVFPAAQTIYRSVIRMGLTNFPLAQINGVDERIDVDVAVLDTGISTNHPDLNVFRNASFVEPELTGNDWDGHGSHVAGIIGMLDNDIGLVGVAPGVRLWNVQVLGQTQHNWNNFLAGLDYVVQHTNEIEVINASLTNNGLGPTPILALRMAISNLVNSGIVYVDSAGNDGVDLFGFNGVMETGDDPDFGVGGTYSDDYWPASIPEALTVSSMGDGNGIPGNDSISYFSNYSSSNAPAPFAPHVNSPGKAIDLTAPGEGILSTYKNTNYATMSGTSMAAAHVSGLVALYIAANGRPHTAAEVYQLRQTLIDTAQPQSAWQTADTQDPDGNQEGLAYASLSWIPRMKFLSATAQPAGLALNFSTMPGYTHTVQYHTNATAPNGWSNLTTTNGTGEPAIILDPITTTTRFYRLETQPAP